MLAAEGNPDDHEFLYRHMEEVTMNPGVSGAMRIQIDEGGRQMMEFLGSLADPSQIFDQVIRGHAGTVCCYLYIKMFSH